MNLSGQAPLMPNPFAAHALLSGIVEWQLAEDATVDNPGITGRSSAKGDADL